MNVMYFFDDDNDEALCDDCADILYGDEEPEGYEYAELTDEPCVRCGAMCD